MSASATFLGPNGSDPVASIIQLRLAVTPNASDGLFGGQLARTFIRDRTARGVGVDGNAFAAYSDSYAKQKTKKGRNSTPVDLFSAVQDSHMLNGILVKSGGLTSSTDMDAPNYTGEPISDFSVGFYEEDIALRAKVHNEGLGRQPERNFFGVSDQERQTIEQKIGERMMIRARTANG